MLDAGGGRHGRRTDLLAGARAEAAAVAGRERPCRRAGLRGRRLRAASARGGAARPPGVGDHRHRQAGRKDGGLGARSPPAARCRPRRGGGGDGPRRAGRAGAGGAVRWAGRRRAVAGALASGDARGLRLPRGRRAVGRRHRRCAPLRRRPVGRHVPLERGRGGPAGRVARPRSDPAGGLRGGRAAAPRRSYGAGHVGSPPGRGADRRIGAGAGASQRPGRDHHGRTRLRRHP